MSALITGEKITVAYETGKQVLHDVSFSVQVCECLGIIGESGSGKTTLAQLLLGILPHRGGKMQSGRLSFAPQQRVAYIPQDPHTAFDPYFSVQTHVNEIVKKHIHASRAEKQKMVSAAFSRVGLPIDTVNLASFPHQLSGGMKQRILIALALLVQPTVLIADEPTSNLDAIHVRNIVKIFLRLRKEDTMSVLLLTHDLRTAEALCDRIFVLLQGRIVEEAAAADIFAHPQHPYTQRLLGSSRFFTEVC